ncbi:unnamed protein product [Phaedon cochleariae]|uniref:Protein-tyrosine-phosphatase n=1 Tax=Phaedon cochleariae TaxID=80249 RepID=A0A9P0GP11_PHACE|nr:unnamed protein product [Phaedon cochleariae]
MMMGHALVYICIAIIETIAQNSIPETTTTVYGLDFGYKKNSFTTDTPTTTITLDFAVPAKPRNLTILDFTSVSIYLQWANPENMNGVIEGYRVYYMNNNYTAVQPDKIPYDNPLIHYNLTKLEPKTEYTIFVKAFTQKHEGYPSESVIATTDISGPTAPKVLNLSCQANETIYIQWERPANFYYSIDYYYIYVNLGNHLYDNITISTTEEHLETAYTLKNVTPDADYKVQIQASTRSNRTHRLIMGQISAESISRNCDKIDYMSHTTSELGAGIVAGILCAAMALVLAGLGFLIWRKCFRAPYYYLDNPQCSTAALDWNITPEPDADHIGPIPVALFARHVQELHADGDIGFSKEYEAIQNDAVNDVNSSEHSQHPENKPKNRYLNIIAYDHSRVHLLTMRGQKISTYINANYIDGFQMNKAYIGTQGPLPSTFDCFWRMVWEQRVTIIVMITNLVERGRRKCDMYWPKEGTETYGMIQVRLVKEDIMATYTVRTLSIRHLRVSIKSKKKAALAEKTVYQYHYTNWPDHGTPDHPLPVIHFIKKSSAANPTDSGPIVVHCSAGVGRTGTYIVLDAMLKQIRARGEVNIFGFLKHIRAQRNFLVQTEEQYIFIHDSLVEAIECGETNIGREKFPRYVSVLQNPNLEDKNELWKPLDVQFRLVTSFVCRDFNLVSANKPVNQSKNRCAVILPVESARVHLTPKPGEDGSDYINASWLQGFHSLREFIITQHPFKHTIHDFWQMVWDHSAQLIVMISYIDNSEYEVFWPEGDEAIETDTYICKQTNENGTSAYFLREFLMKSVQDDYEIPVKMLHCVNWPHQVASLSELYHLPNFVLDMQKIQNGPIIIVDRFGGTEAASFCALTTLKKHLIYDNKVDVYMYTKLYHNKRPGIWISSDDYMKLHLCVQTLCSPPEPQIQEVTPDLYAMTNGTVNNGSISTDCIRVPPEGPAGAIAATQEGPSTNADIHDKSTDPPKDRLRRAGTTKFRRRRDGVFFSEKENILDTLSQRLNDLKSDGNHASDSEIAPRQSRRSRTKSFDKNEAWVHQQDTTERVIWHKLPEQTFLVPEEKETTFDNNGPQISSLSSTQRQVLRKLALLKLTAHMEKYCPTHRTGWNWDLPKFIRKIKCPVYKDKNIFGVPLTITFQRTGRVLPRQIEEAMRWLQENSTDDVGIFRKPGVRSRIQHLHDKVESNIGIDYSDQQCYDVADMVKQYYRELPEVLLTTKLSETFILIFQYVPVNLRRESVLCAILLLPDEHMEVLQSLLHFLLVIAKNSQVNQMNENNLAMCFAPTLFHYSPGLKQNLGSPHPKELAENKAGHSCLLFFLNNYHNLFRIPQDFINQCNPSEIRETKAKFLSELGMEMGGWREYLNECESNLLREVKERGRGWIPISSHNPKVDISYRKVADGLPLKLWRTSTDVEAPPSEVVRRILRERHIWDNDLQSAKIIAQLDHRTEVFQFVRRNIDPLPNEEYCVLRTWRTDLPKDTCIIVETSVEYSDALPVPNTSRAVILASRYLIEPCGSGKSRLIHFSRIDTMGRTPEWYQKNYGHLCAIFLSNIQNSFYQNTRGPESKV